MLEYDQEQNLRPSKFDSHKGLQHTCPVQLKQLPTVQVSEKENELKWQRQKEINIWSFLKVH